MIIRIFQHYKYMTLKRTDFKVGPVLDLSVKSLS